MDIKREVLLAERRIRPHIRETPLEYSVHLSGKASCNVHLKLENLQHTGSFKTRGAVGKLLSLTKEERERGVITASTGNHALAVAYGLKRFGIKGTIYLTENVSSQKIAMLRNYGVSLKFYGRDCVTTEKHAREESERTGAVYLSPYNDEKVIAGQGTVATELLRQLDTVDHVFVSVGGGGLISGVAGFLKEKGTNAKITGCLPKNSPVMYDSIKAGQIVESRVLPTLSGGTAGGIEPGAITFDMCRDYVDDWVLVSEDEIRKAMQLIFEQHRLVIEGAAGVCVAAFLRVKEVIREKRANVVLILCGGNIEIEKFKEIVC